MANITPEMRNMLEEVVASMRSTTWLIYMITTLRFTSEVILLSKICYKFRNCDEDLNYTIKMNMIKYQDFNFLASY